VKYSPPEIAGCRVEFPRVTQIVIAPVLFRWGGKIHSDGNGASPPEIHRIGKLQDIEHFLNPNDNIARVS
jgi:hypothetical protein